MVLNSLKEMYLSNISKPDTTTMFVCLFFYTFSKSGPDKGNGCHETRNIKGLHDNDYKKWTPGLFKPRFRQNFDFLI